jgi:hypothetical protein
MRLVEEPTVLQLDPTPVKEVSVMMEETTVNLGLTNVEVISLLSLGLDLKQVLLTALEPSVVEVTFSTML